MTRSVPPPVPLARLVRSQKPPFADAGPIGRLAVRLVGAPGLLWRSIGVDPGQLRALLTMDMTLSQRRGKQAMREGAATGFNMGLWVTLLINLLFGGMAAALIALLEDPLWGIGGALAVVMAVLTMVLVGDFLPTLVETADVDVFGAQPVGDRTALAARLCHISTLLAVNLIGLSVGPLIAGAAAYGWLFVPLWLFGVLSITLTTLGLAFGLFLAAMRMFDVERFRDLLLFLQVGVMVAVFGGFQFVPRLAGAGFFEEVVGQREWWMLALPPFHVAGLHVLFVEAGARGSELLVTLGVMGLIVPLATIVLLVGWLGEGFVANLGAMAAAGRGAGTPRRTRSFWQDRLTRTGEARAGYGFVAALSRRERTFRMRTYPLVGMAAVIGFAITLGPAGVGGRGMLCGAVYFLGMYAPLTVLIARFSDNHEAGWMFEALPLQRRGEFLYGALLALLMTFTIPSLLLMSALVLVVGGLRLVPDVLFAGLVVVGISAASSLVLGRQLPFTAAAKKNPNEGHTGSLILLSLLVGLAAGVHALLRQWDVVFYAVLAVLPVLVGWMVSRLRAIRPARSSRRR